MKMGMKDIDWKYVGALLAQSDGNEQTTFFKAFVKECNSWGTRHQIEMQLSDVNSKLTVTERQVLSMIGFEEE